MALPPELLRLYRPTDLAVPAQEWRQWAKAIQTVEAIKALRMAEANLRFMQAGDESVTRQAKADGLAMAVRLIDNLAQGNTTRPTSPEEPHEEESHE